MDHVDMVACVDEYVTTCSGAESPPPPEAPAAAAAVAAGASPSADPPALMCIFQAAVDRVTGAVWRQLLTAGATIVVLSRLPEASRQCRSVLDTTAEALAGTYPQLALGRHDRSVASLSRSRG